MSVINKMLRDLDQRQPVDHTPQAINPPINPLSHPVPHASAAPLRWRTGTKALLLLGVLAAGAAGTWLYQRPAPSAAPARAVPAEFARSESQATALPELLEQAPTAATPVVAPTPEPTPQASLRPLPADAPEAQLKTSLTLTLQAAAPAPPSLQTAAPALVEKAPALAEKAPANWSVANAALSDLPTPPLMASPTEAIDVLAQARALGRNGATEGAIALLQEALAVLERMGLPATPVADNSPMANIARELARLETVQGRPASALALLTRLTPALSGVSDLWASRGNAAQRLGLHGEAINAYKAALNLRSAEPRWMLGLAVSLGAQGELVPAAQWAEKARQAGALKPDIAEYLRELGVPLNP